MFKNSAMREWTGARRETRKERHFKRPRPVLAESILLLAGNV